MPRVYCDRPLKSLDSEPVNWSDKIKNRETRKTVAGATHLQLSRIIAIVLKGNTAVLTLFMCVDGIRVQSQVCPGTVAITLRKRSAGTIGIRAYGKSSGDDSGVLVNQACLRHLAGIACWKPSGDIAWITLWCSGR